MGEARAYAKLKPEELKSGGFIPQRQKGMVTVRCRAPGGRVTSQRLRKIAEVAEKYGQGLVHLSVRMSPEILYIRLDDLEAVIGELAEAGQAIASCGRRVRVPTACGGCEYNPNGLVDTVRLAEAVDSRFFGTDTHHKFKISFSGCPIDCMRAREMDLGFQGMAEPTLYEPNCTSCTLCVKACQDDALKMDEEGKYPVRNWANCISCGDCIKVCPFDAMRTQRVGHALYVGGRHGKHPHVAYPIAGFVPDGMVFPVIEMTLQWYRLNGKPGERIGTTVDRVGIDSLRGHLKPLLGDLLLGQQEVNMPKWRKIFWGGVAEAFPAYGQV